MGLLANGWTQDSEGRMWKACKDEQKQLKVEEQSNGQIETTRSTSIGFQGIHMTKMGDSSMEKDSKTTKNKGTMKKGMP